MAFRHISRELYDNLLRGYREFPGNHSNAARIAGCTQPMAKRGWETGWSPKVPWARPLKQVLREEQEAARAEQRRMEEEDKLKSADERDKVRQDAVKALATEGQMLHAGRTNILAALASASQLIPAFRTLLQQANVALVDPAFKADPGKSLRMFRDFGHAVRNLVEASNRLIEAERRSKGEPSTIIGLEVGGEMTMEDAQETIEDVTALYELARERGLISSPADKNGSGGQGGNGEVH